MHWLAAATAGESCCYKFSKANYEIVTFQIRLKKASMSGLELSV